MKIRPVGAEFFIEEGKTDMMKLIAAASNYTNAPENVRFSSVIVWCKIW